MVCVCTSIRNDFATAKMFADTRASEWNETINVQMIMGQFTGSGIQCTGSLSFGAFQTGIIAMYAKATGRAREGE